MLDPIVTSAGIDWSAPHVVAVCLAAIVIGVLGVAFRATIFAALEVLADLWREHGGTVIGSILDRRRNLPRTPWFCIECKSHNERMMRYCYKCGATREAAEAPVPDADTPGGPGAGLAQRNQRKG
jgi:hypothetical protein